MSRLEKQENEVLERLTGQKQSAAYRSARRANIPVTVLRGETIYRVTKEGSVAIGKVEPKVKISHQVFSLRKNG